MKIFVIPFFLFIATALGNDLSHIDEIAKGKLIHGEAVKADSLKGKVILFEYWSFN